MKPMVWVYGSLEQILVTVKNGYPDAFGKCGLRLPLTILEEGDSDSQVGQALQEAIYSDKRVSDELKEEKEFSVRLLYVATASRQSVVTVSGKMCWEDIGSWVLSQFAECKASTFAVIIKPRERSCATPFVWLFTAI